MVHNQYHLAEKGSKILRLRTESSQAGGGGPLGDAWSSGPGHFSLPQGQLRAYTPLLWPRDLPVSHITLPGDL